MVLIRQTYNKGVGTGWDGPLLGNSLARWTFIGSPIWFERGQVLKFYDPVHYIGAAKKVRNDPGRRFVVSWIQEAENGLTVTHQVLNKDDTKSSWTSDRWAGGAASVVAIDGGVGPIERFSLLTRFPRRMEPTLFSRSLPQPWRLL